MQGGSGGALQNHTYLWLQVHMKGSLSCTFVLLAALAMNSIEVFRLTNFESQQHTERRRQSSLMWP